MDTSLLLARIFGVSLIVVYGSVLFNQKFFKLTWKSLLQQPILLFITGFLSLILGLIVTQIHNIWAADWRGVITCLGWFLLISGMVRILFPAIALQIQSQLLNSSRSWINAIAGLLFLVGLYLTYVGFISH